MQKTPLSIVQFVDAMYAQNSRVVHFENDRACWVIDPGLPPSGSSILEYLNGKDLLLDAIILTHAHADHIAGIPLLLEAYPNTPVYLAREEWGFLDDPSQNLSLMAGMELSVAVDKLHDLPEGESIELGESSWQVSDTSGHSPGGRTLYCAEQGVAIVGDALFAGSIGRVDFPHSDGPRLLANIREKLLTLPGDTRVCSGHGPDTTIEIERRSNPFLVP